MIWCPLPLTLLSMASPKVGRRDLHDVHSWYPWTDLRRRDEPRLKAEAPSFPKAGTDGSNFLEIWRKEICPKRDWLTWGYSILRWKGVWHHLWFHELHATQLDPCVWSAACCCHPPIVQRSAMGFICRGILFVGTINHGLYIELSLRDKHRPHPDWQP
jgi:hypothetical protein